MARKTAKTQEPKKEVAPFDFNSFNFKISHDFKLTKKQRDILKVAHLPDTKIIILDGYPGTGKTMTSMIIGLEKLRDKVVNGITAFRSTVQSKDGETGFIPGEISDKTKFMMGPFNQKMEELIPSKSDRETVTNKMFDFLPTSFVRSYSFRDECLILSEAQNNFFESIFTVASRAGEGSFVIIEGDSIMQNDLGEKSGFNKFCQMFNDQESRDNGVYYYKFDEKDIVRSDIVQYLVTKRLKTPSPLGV